MNALPFLAAAPRAVLVAGAPHLATSATLGDLATLRAFLDDAASGVAFGSPEAAAALSGGAGFALVAHLALRRNRPGLAFAASADLAATMDDAERSALAGAFFRRLERPATGDGRTLDDLDWPRLFFAILRAHPSWTYGTLASLTPEQAEHAQSGELAGVDAGDGRPLDEAEVAAFFGGPAAAKGADHG